MGEYVYRDSVAILMKSPPFALKTVKCLFDGEKKYIFYESIHTSQLFVLCFFFHYFNSLGYDQEMIEEIAVKSMRFLLFFFLGLNFFFFLGLNKKNNSVCAHFIAQNIYEIIYNSRSYVTYLQS